MQCNARACRDGKFTQENIRLLSADICDGLYEKVCLKVQDLEKQKAAKQMEKEREKINNASDAFKRLFVSADDSVLMSASAATPAKSGLGTSGGLPIGSSGKTLSTGSVIGKDPDGDDSAESLSMIRRKKKSIRRKSSRTVKDERERWQEDEDRADQQWREEQREKELDKRKQECEREDTVESAKDIIIADFTENLDKGEFKIGLNGDCVPPPSII
jgi:hypothetical protein